MLVAIDFETHLISEHEKIPKPVCMSLCREDGHEALYVSRHEIADAITAIEDRDTVIAHNGAAFDFPIASRYCGSSIVDRLRRGRARDTLLWSQLADFAEGVNHRPPGFGDGKGYGLAACVKRRFGVDVAKGADTWRLRYAELDGLSVNQWPDDAIAYVMNDARLCLALAKTLRDVPDVARKTYQFFWLALSSARGAYTDIERAAEWRASLEADVAAYAPHLQAAGILRADGTRDLSVIRARLGTEGKKTPKGEVSADREACSASSDPLVKLYSLYVDRQDKLSKEVKTVERGLVHTRYSLAESGRTTSSDPALQNIGVKSLARRCFRARPGLLYVVTDYGMLELCCIAQLCVVMGCGDTMARAISSGADVHDMLARQIDPTVDPKSIRRLAKEGNFGRNGGMGWQTLIATAHKRGVEINEATAKRIIAAHRAQWPEIAGYQSTSYHERVKAELERTGGVLAHYRSGRLRGRLSFTQGANTLFQGLGSEVNLDAFVMLSEEGLMPSLSVHDEYHHEVSSEKEVERIGEICRAVGAEWLPHAPPKADPKIVEDWSKAK